MHTTREKFGGPIADLTAQTLPEPEAERRFRSYSSLNEYNQCSWQWYLKRVLRLPELPGYWNAGGNAIHKTSEQIDWQSWEGRPLAEILDEIESWEQTFEANLEDEIARLLEKEPDQSLWRASQKGKTQKWPGGEDTVWWRDKGRAMIRRYVEWRISTDDTLKIATVKGGPAVEVEILTQLGGVLVKAFVDKVMEDTRTGVLLVVDRKSGRRMPDTHDQLGTYSVMFEQHFDRPLTWGAFYNVRQARLVGPFDLTRYTAQKLGDKFDQFEAAVAAEQFKPNVTFLCGTCGVRRFCKFQGGQEP